MHPKPSICFVALNAYNVLAHAQDLTHIGGAEVQQVLLARALVRLGYKVSFVVLDHGQGKTCECEGIAVYPAYRLKAGAAFLRFFHPRLSGLWSAMRRADADVYYQRCAGIETGLVSMWCRHHHRRFIFGIAHDDNCKPDLPALSARRERWLYRYGLSRADLVIAQTYFQQSRLRCHFGVEARVIHNCHEPLPVQKDEPVDVQPCERSGVLWVGRFSSAKRLEWCIDIAERLTDYSFTIVGEPANDSGKTRALLSRARSLPHVRMCGYVPRERIGRLYRRAAVLLCTSSGEGFPNTFLEAWSCGTPVVSTVDPDGVILRHKLGRVSEDREGLCRLIREFPPMGVAWQECSRGALAYVRAHHDLEAIAVELADAFAVVCAPG